MAAPRVIIKAQSRYRKTITVFGVVTGKPTTTTINLPASAVPNGAVSRPQAVVQVNPVTGEFIHEFVSCPYGDYAEATVTAINSAGEQHSASSWPMRLYVEGQQPVGTPAVEFPPFTAPVLVAPSIALDQKITDFTVVSNSDVEQVNVPFTFGQPFKQGELSPKSYLVGRVAGQANIPLQFNVKSTWQDGSVRHAVISGRTTLAAKESKTIDLVRSATSTYTTDKALNSSLFNGFITKARAIVNGVEYFADPKAIFDANGPWDTVWLAGSFCNDYITNLPFKDAQGNEHPHLTAQFSIRTLGTNRAKIDVAFEHTKVFQATSEITYDAAILRGTVVEWEKVGLVHRPGARFKKTVYLGTAPSLYIKHNARYFLDTCMVPNWDLNGKFPEAEVAKWGNTTGPLFEPMNHGLLYKSMGTTGGRGDIGVVPMYAAGAIMWGDERAIRATLIHGDIAAGAWGTHQRDATKKRPATTVFYPRLSHVGTSGDRKNYSTGVVEALNNSNYGADSAHQASMGYVPYLLTGDFYYLEEQLFWTNFNIHNTNPGYRKSFYGIIDSHQLRGQAWSMRTFAQTAAICPDDHPDKQAYLFYLDRNFSYYNTTFVDAPNSNKLGLIDNDTVYDAGFDSAGLPLKNNAQSCFQEDHFTTSMGHAAELGFPEAKRLASWKARYPIGRMVGAGFFYVRSANYDLRVKETLDSPVYESFAQVYEGTFRHLPEYLALPWLSEEQTAWLVANVSSSYVTGQILGDTTTQQPALAFSVDFGRMPNRDLAWQRYFNRPKKPEYGFGPQHWVLPRTDGLAIDPIEPVDPPVFPKGTLASSFCDGTTKMGNFHDGNGGYYNAVIQEKSVDCGYVDPDTPVPPDPDPDPVDPEPPQPVPEPPTTNGNTMTIADRVKDSTTTTGTGAFVLSGTPETNFRPFLTAPIKVGDTVPYAARHRTLNEWENGFGTLTEAKVLTRTKITSSSNGDQQVNFSAGIKDISCDLTAAFVERLVSPDTPSITSIANPEKLKLVVMDDGIPKQISFSDATIPFNVLTSMPSVLPTDEVVINRTGGDGRATISVIAAAVAALLGNVAPPPATNVKPVLSGASGTVTGATTVSISVTTNEGEGTIYYLLSPNSIVSASQVKAGTGVAINSAGAKTFMINGLQPSTMYYAHFLHRDAGGLESDVVVSASFTTQASGATQPTVTSVAVNPAQPTVNAGQTQQFTAVVSGTNSPSQNVTWSTTAGSINGSGLFTAPPAINVEQNVIITATSTQDPSKSGTTTVTVPATGLTDYVITGYTTNGVKNEIRAGLDNSTTNASYVYSTLHGFSRSKYQTATYWSIAHPNGGPAPASAMSGWGTSATVPPAQTTKNTSGSESENGLTSMGNPGAWGNANNILWLAPNFTGKMYYWIVPEGGVPKCMNPAGLQVTQGSVSNPSPTVSTVEVTPANVNMVGGGVQQFSVNVLGSDSPSQSVIWSVTGGGSIDVFGVYTAPATTDKVQNVTITAQSEMDPTKYGTATVTVAAAPAKVYTITPYTAGNTIRPTFSRSTDAAGSYSTTGHFFSSSKFTVNGGTYWNVNPNAPAGTNVRAGWGRSNTVPPNEITTSQNSAGNNSLNGLVPMTDRTDPSWEHQGYLWAAPDYNGPYYFWIRVGTENTCINANSGLMVTA